MLHDRTVLGWARAGTICPDSVHICKAGEPVVLLVDKERAADARACLKWQVACFDAGVEFLPVAPLSKLSESDAIAVARAQREQLLEELDRLAGQGQLTLGMTWSDTCATNIDSVMTGRDWLQSRMQAHSSTQAIAQRVTACLDRFNRPEYASKTRQMSQRIERDLLLPKNKVEALIEDIAKTARHMEAGGFDLTITGLWPPFSFVQRFLHKRDMSA